MKKRTIILGLMIAACLVAAVYAQVEPCQPCFKRGPQLAYSGKGSIVGGACAGVFHNPASQAKSGFNIGSKTCYEAGVKFGTCGPLNISAACP